MNKIDFIKTAHETIAICENGYYELNGEKIQLCEKQKYNDAEAIGKKKHIEIQNKIKSISAEESNGSRRYAVWPLDSLTAAKELPRPLVMNFANAVHVGGGFLHGARAQEESLCRCSTLYQSISSKKAAEMYKYNNKHKNPIDSDYMILSKDVCVFRDCKCNLLKEPYTVSVMTIPALDLYGRAGDLSKDTVKSVTMDRMRKYFSAAAFYGYRNLVLGAWGCGAFGHNAKNMAEYFKNVLADEGYDRFFDNIVFAVIGSEYNFKAFYDVFAAK